MNLFIDTSVIYTDPFWTRNFAAEVLDSARDKRIRIFIADVVVKELRYNFEKQVLKQINSIKNSNLTIRRIASRHKNTDLPKIEDYLKDFDDYYESIFQIENVTKLEATKDHFNEILDRAILKRRPFSDKKSEFKDTVIWMTYYKYALENKLNICQLLTNNVNDFCDPKDKNELHIELKADSDKFSIYQTLKDFYDAHKDYISQPTIAFTKWMNEKKVDEDYVFNLLFASHENTIYDEIVREYEDITPSDFFDDDPYLSHGGYVIIKDVEWDDCIKLEIDIIKDYAIISGQLIIDLTIDLFRYDPMAMIGDEDHTFYTDIRTKSYVAFRFVYNRSEQAINIEVNSVT